MAQNWTIQKTMIEWTFALSDLTISFGYSHLGYKWIWVHEKNFSITIEASGTKFNYTQSKDSDDLIQAFPMLYSIVTVELYVSSITSYFVILIDHKLLYWSNLNLHLPVKAALAIGKKS